MAYGSTGSAYPPMAPGVASSAASSAASGAAKGSIAGPPGALLGAGIGAAGGIAQGLIGKGQNKRQLAAVKEANDQAMAIAKEQEAYDRHQEELAIARENAKSMGGNMVSAAIKDDTNRHRTPMLRDYYARMGYGEPAEYQNLGDIYQKYDPSKYNTPYTPVTLGSVARKG